MTASNAAPAITTPTMIPVDIVEELLESLVSKVCSHSLLSREYTFISL